jgi:hypothetical protein
MPKSIPSPQLLRIPCPFGLPRVQSLAERFLAVVRPFRAIRGLPFACPRPRRIQWCSTLPHMGEPRLI